MEAFKEKVNDQGSNLECCDVCASRGETGDATVIDMSTSLSVADNTALQSVVSRTVDEEDRTFLRFIPGLQTSKFRRGKNTEDSD